MLKTRSYNHTRLCFPGWKPMFYLLPVFFLVACNNLKKIPAGDALYTGATLKIDSLKGKKKEGKELHEELSSLLRPKPNRKILGMRVRLSAYNLAGNPKKESSIGGWLKYKFGEPPVLMSQVNLERNISVLQNRMENDGYFQVRVTGDTQIVKQKGSAKYHVEAGPQYSVANVYYDSTSSVLNDAILSVTRESLLKTGVPF